MYVRKCEIFQYFIHKYDEISKIYCCHCGHRHIHHILHIGHLSTVLVLHRIYYYFLPRSFYNSRSFSHILAFLPRFSSTIRLREFQFPTHPSIVAFRIKSSERARSFMYLIYYNTCPVVHKYFV